MINVEERFKYTRYVIDDGERDDGEMDGVITILMDKIKDKIVDTYDSQLYEEVMSWYNKVVPVPPYYANRGYWTINSLAYWKSDRREIHEYMFSLIGICERVNLKTKVILTNDPGFILYEDAFQVVAKKNAKKSKR